MKFISNRNVRLGETVYYGEHPSGLRVYVMPKAGYSKSGAYFATNYGSVDRQFILPGEKGVTTVPDGIAHFLEHKMFEQPDGGNVFEAFSRYGANANAFTSFTMTAYYFTCSENLYENLDVLLDFVTSPYFTKENVEKEQGIIGQEIRMYDDDPDWRVYFNAIKCMYHNHPVKIDIAGTEESISHIDDALLYQCYHSFYDPSNMALFVIGEYDPEKVSEMIDRHIKQQEKQGEITRVFQEEPLGIVQPLAEQNLSVAVPQFVLGFKDKNVGGDPVDMLRRDVVTNLILEMSVGKSSPLFKELYENGDIFGALDVEYSFETSYGFSMISGEAKDPEQVKDRILREFTRLADEGFSDFLVERAKRAAYGRFVRTLNNIENIGTTFLGDAFKGIDSLASGEVIMSVTPEEIMERLREHFIPEQAVLSIVRPTETC